MLSRWWVHRILVACVPAGIVAVYLRYRDALSLRVAFSAAERASLETPDHGRTSFDRAVAAGFFPADFTYPACPVDERLLLPAWRGLDGRLPPQRGAPVGVVQRLAACRWRGRITRATPETDNLRSTGGTP